MMTPPDRPEKPVPREAPHPKRQAAQRFGLSAETKAAALLLAKGYRILARRFKTPVGEIDIVAQYRSTLVFIEVKARNSFDAAAEAVTARQQARIIDAAQYWLASHPDAVECPIRFDAVLVVRGSVPRHLPDAFDATMRG